jgi:hypothetical protein
LKNATGVADMNFLPLITLGDVKLSIVPPLFLLVLLFYVLIPFYESINFDVLHPALTSGGYGYGQDIADKNSEDGIITEVSACSCHQSFVAGDRESEPSAGQERERLRR